MDRQLQEHLLQCFEPDTAQAEPELLAAAVKLAASAAMHHASLLDVLFFPTALAPAAPEGKVHAHMKLATIPLLKLHLPTMPASAILQTVSETSATTD